MESLINRGHVSQADMSVELLHHAHGNAKASCKTWVVERNSTIDALNELVKDLNTHHKFVNVASLTGTSVCALCGICGLLFARVTGGASAVLIIGGAIASVIGFRLSLIEVEITHFRCKNTQPKITSDKTSSIALIEEMKKIVEDVHKVKTFLETTQFTAGVESDVDLVEIAVRSSYLGRLYKFYKSALAPIQECIRRMQEFEPVNIAFQRLTKIFQKDCENGNSFQKEFVEEILPVLEGFLKNQSTLAKGVRFGLSALIVVVVWRIITTSIDVYKGSTFKVAVEIGEINNRFIQERNDINSLIADLE